MAHPEVVDRKGVGTLFMMVGQHIGLAILPIVGACFVAGLVAAAGQVGLKPTPEAIKPDFKKLNPASGLKNLFNPQHFAFESGQERPQDRDRRRDRRRWRCSRSSTRWRPSWARRRSS